MTDNNEHIDKLFKNNLKDLRIESTPQNISMFSKAIAKHNFLQFSLGSFNIYFSALAASIVITGSVLVIKPFSNTEKKEDIEIMNNDTLTDRLIQKNIECQKPLIEEIVLQKEDQPDLNTQINNLVPKDIIEEIDETEANNNIEIPERNNSHDTSLVVVHDTVVVEKKVIIRDTVKTIIHKKKNH